MIRRDKHADVHIRSARYHWFRDTAAEYAVGRFEQNEFAAIRIIGDFFWAVKKSIVEGEDRLRICCCAHSKREAEDRLEIGVDNPAEHKTKGRYLRRAG